ncbi:hypothetical protein RBB80_08715 [Tunturiibacter gelidiferens]
MDEIEAVGDSAEEARYGREKKALDWCSVEAHDDESDRSRGYEPFDCGHRPGTAEVPQEWDAEVVEGDETAAMPRRMNEGGYHTADGKKLCRTRGIYGLGRKSYAEVGTAA